jgi:hypothetical protein
MGGVTIGSEANTSASEDVHELQGGVSACFPCLPDSQRRLTFINVTRPFHAEAPVFFVAAMAAIAADNAV